MAQPLSFLFQTNNAADVRGMLTQAFSAPSISPAILHYAWVVSLPSPPSQPNYMLLSTTYDENFASYIADLVNANPDLFNAAAKSIVGLENIVLPRDLSQFTAFILKNDLTGGGQAPGFFQAYTATVKTILAALGG